MREKVTASIIFKERKASYPRSVSHPFLGDYVRLRQNVQWKKISIETNDQYVVFADIINKITRSSGKFVPILFVLSTNSMLILDQRTLQVKYRIPASEVYRLSLSPYLDDVAVFHVKAVSTALEFDFFAKPIPFCATSHRNHNLTEGVLILAVAMLRNFSLLIESTHIIWMFISERNWNEERRFRLPDGSRHRNRYQIVFSNSERNRKTAGSEH